MSFEDMDANKDGKLEWDEFWTHMLKFTKSIITKQIKESMKQQQ